jgi:hypothetical protein
MPEFLGIGEGIMEQKYDSVTVKDELDAAIERNGGHTSPANMDILLSAISEKVYDEDMKFSNSDISLDEAVERNDGHVSLANMDIVMDVVLDTSWK